MLCGSWPFSANFRYSRSNLETRFENLARLKLTAGRTQYLEGGSTLDALIWETLDSFKLDYGT